LEFNDQRVSDRQRSAAKSYHFADTFSRAQWNPIFIVREIGKQIPREKRFSQPVTLPSFGFSMKTGMPGAFTALANQMLFDARILAMVCVYCRGALKSLLAS